MKKWKEYRFIQLIVGIYVQMVFLVLTTLVTAFFLLFERLFQKEDRPQMWRMVSHRLSHILLRLSGVLIHVAGHLPDHDFPVIYASNHPSMLDPFVYFTLFGPNIVPIVAPAKSFVFPFNIFLKKFGAVPVLRDDSDRAEFAGSGIGTKDAVNTLIARAESGLNILIFPEGHIERDKKMHYIHTGAARVAIGVGIPVVPLTLLGMDRVGIDSLHVRPGTITVHIGKLIEPPQVSQIVSNHKAVRAMSEMIDAAIATPLPKRNLPAYRNAKHPERIGVFVDIDRTLYAGYSQQDFVSYLMHTHRIRKRVALHIFRLILLEKLHFISHEDLMKKTLSILDGKKESTMKKHAQEFFKKEFVYHISHTMIPAMKDHQEAGHTIVLVTEVITPLAKQFQKYFHTKTCFETKLRTKHGRYTGDVTRLCWREEKAIAIKKFAETYDIDLSQSYAYGDSENDIPMLKLVGRPHAVNPDNGLKKEAEKRRWRILG